MKILIDGRASAPDTIPGENLEEILSELQDNHLTGNMVGEVLLNGRVYNEDVPHAALEVSRSEIDSLELTTHSAEEIALHFIEHGHEILGSMLDSLPKIVEIFRIGDEAEASEHYLGFLETLQLLFSMLNSVSQTLQVDFDSQIDGEFTLNQKLTRLSDVMSELLRIQGENDWIYLADILEHELTKELEDFQVFLPQIRSKLH
ncbi:MAG: hypothetical protein JRD68_01345 [Deltaproteobacteria bacterium]|nr:hypothetical protein [Deltaproteobacteria bacterium]